MSQTKEVITIRVSKETKEELQKDAKNHLTPFSSHVCSILNQYTNSKQLDYRNFKVVSQPSEFGNFITAFQTLKSNTEIEKIDTHFDLLEDYSLAQSLKCRLSNAYAIAILPITRLSMGRYAYLKKGINFEESPTIFYSSARDLSTIKKLEQNNCVSLKREKAANPISAFRKYLLGKNSGFICGPLLASIIECNNLGLNLANPNDTPDFYYSSHFIKIKNGQTLYPEALDSAQLLWEESVSWVNKILQSNQLQEIKRIIGYPQTELNEIGIDIDETVLEKYASNIVEHERWFPTIDDSIAFFNGKDNLDEKLSSSLM